MTTFNIATADDHAHAIARAIGEMGLTEIDFDGEDGRVFLVVLSDEPISARELAERIAHLTEIIVDVEAVPA